MSSTHETQSAMRSENSQEAAQGQQTVQGSPQNPAAENRDDRGNEESPEVPAEEQPDDGREFYIYFLENRNHHDWDCYNNAVIIAENETQARQIAHQQFHCMGTEYDLSGKPNFWELPECASILRLGTAEDAEYPSLVNYNRTGD